MSEKRAHPGSSNNKRWGKKVAQNIGVEEESMEYKYFLSNKVFLVRTFIKRRPNWTDSIRHLRWIDCRKMITTKKCITSHKTFQNYLQLTQKIFLSWQYHDLVPFTLWWSCSIQFLPRNWYITFLHQFL